MVQCDEVMMAAKKANDYSLAGIQSEKPEEEKNQDEELMI